MTNFRFWGGWFLVFAGLSILLTMGCEKGALGVKSATVTGKVVDKDNTNTPVPNAIVRMMSKEAVGSGELPQGSNFMATNTDANGNFIFENVSADNVVLEVNANGYAKILYPSTQAATTEDGQTEEAGQVQSVYVRSGSVTNVGYLAMTKISNPLPETISTSIVFRDATTLELIDEKAGPITVSFNNQTVTLPVSNWRDGIDLTGNPHHLNS